MNQDGAPVNSTKTNFSIMLHVAVISLAGLLIYSNTLTTVFQFDDKLNIVDNPFIRNLGNLWPPSGARWFGYLTFALNYAVGGLNPLGYHLINLFIHIFTALAVYLLVLLTFRTPYCANHRDRVISGDRIALACALLFVVHPIQTQAITYIVQRFASLAALLFILSIDFYILARLSFLSRSAGKNGSQWKAALLFAASGIFAVLSLKTKENAYTLPVVAVLFEVMFISGLSPVIAAIRNRWRIVAGTSAGIIVSLLILSSRYDLASLFESFKATNEISRHDYLITQFRVIITYIRLLFLPVGQSIDHHYPVYQNLFTPQIIASVALIAVLTALAVYLYHVSRQGTPYARLISFGIFWFFITLSIESSVIPIIDVMFEHRLYLPSIGAILAVIAACAAGLERVRFTTRETASRTAACILIIVTVTLACAAYARNRVWKNELTLWKDVIAKTPANPRGYNMVGSYYQAHFRVLDAISYYRKALEVDSFYAEARSNLGNAYLQIGRLDEGLNELLMTERTHRFDAVDTGILYYNIGKAYFMKGMPDLAIEKLKLALLINPNEAAVHNLFGQVYQSRHLDAQSAASFQRAHELNPDKF